MDNSDSWVLLGDITLNMGLVGSIEWKQLDEVLVTTYSPVGEVIVNLNETGAKQLVAWCRLHRIAVPEVFNAPST